MKGIIFNLVEEVVMAGWGEDAWDQILERAGLDGAYTSLGNYPDSDLSALVGAAAGLTGEEPGAIVRLIGEGALPLLAQRYSEFFTPYDNARSFVLTLNDIIHAEVRKLYPGADVPEFGFDTTDPDVLVVTYRSPRRLCLLAEGFLVGAAMHYRQTAAIEQPQCMLRGDDECHILCRFAAAQ